MLGIASRSAASRSHGSSARKRSATSYVAPPQHSTDQSSGVVRATCSATASRSRERTRVASSDWWASRNVVSVTATRSWARSRRANSSGPTSRSSWRVPVGHGLRPVERRQLAGRRHRDRRLAVRLVDGDVGEVGQQPRGAVAADLRLEELRVVLDERRGHAARGEVGVGEHGLEEADVGGDAADAELQQRAPRLLHRRLEGAAATGELGEHRVEVRADLGAGVRRTAVEAHARTAGGAVGGDLPGVGAEAVGRVLRGDPALEREAARVHHVLGEPEVGERGAGRDQHLRLDEVDRGDLLGHGVLDLDAGVHLDEDVAPVRVEEELDGAGVLVADLAGEAHRVGAHPVPDLGVQARSRGDLDDLLVAALHGAVALVEVDHAALGARAVGEDLHLDVARVDDGLLDEDGRVAEGALGLAHAGLDRLAQVGPVLDLPHPATAAAGDGLDEERRLDGLRGGQQGLDVGRRVAPTRAPVRRRPWPRRSRAPCCR